MKKQIVFIAILTLPCLFFGEMEMPEFIRSNRTIDSEKEQEANIQEALRQKAEQNYRNKFFADSRQEKYLTRARNLSTETQRLLVTREAHESSTAEDIERLTQEIAREKKLKSKLWFNSEKSGTLINDLETLKEQLQKKETKNISTPESPAATYFKAHDATQHDVGQHDANKHDVGAKAENNPLSPKKNFDYDTWKKELEKQQENIQDEQNQINKKITALKKQEKNQQDKLAGIDYQKNEILKNFSQKTLSSDHIDYISNEIVKYQAEAENIEQERLKDFKFTTFGIHKDNEKLPELKKQISTWKQELDAYDHLQALKDQEQTIHEKIQNLQDQQKIHTNNLKALNEQLKDRANSINNADFHLKRVSKYLDSLS